MKIEWVIPGRYVEVRDNIATIVGAGGDSFMVSEEPWTIEIMLAIRISAMVEELIPERIYSVENSIRDPNGKVIQEQVGSFSATLRSGNADTSWLQGVWVPAEAKFSAEIEGTYTVTHRFGDSEHLLPLHVSHGPKDGEDRPVF